MRRPFCKNQIALHEISAISEILRQSHLAQTTIPNSKSSFLPKLMLGLNSVKSSSRCLDVLICCPLYYQSSEPNKVPKKVTSECISLILSDEHMGGLVQEELSYPSCITLCNTVYLIEIYLFNLMESVAF